MTCVRLAVALLALIAADQPSCAFEKHGGCLQPVA